MPAPTTADVAAALRLAAAATGRRAVSQLLLGGGHRHLMLRVTCDDGRMVTVRIARHADAALATEAAVLDRAARVVRVPHVLLCDAAGALTGRSALVLTHVDGVPGDRVLAGASADEALQVGALLGATAAALGRVGFPRPGLFNGPDLRTADDGGPLSELVLPFVDRGLDAVPAALLDLATAASWRALVATAASDLHRVDDAAALVHADFNPKNVVLRRHGDRWDLAALVDWEFAMAGSALVDLGNAQRFAHLLPNGYATAIGQGFHRAGGTLPADWRRLAATIDASALGEMLARDGGTTALRGDILAVIRRAAARNSLVTTER